MQKATPRETFKQAFQINLVKDGHSWMEALDDRNLIAHTYDESTAIKVEQFIAGKYFPLLQQLYDTFKYNEIKNQELKHHIDHYGKIIYEKS